MGNFEQSVARTHRHGQERPTTFVFLIAQRESGRPTIDRLIRNAIAKRKEVIDVITSSRFANNILREKGSGIDPEAAAIIEGIIVGNENSSLQEEAISDALSFFGGGNNEED